MHTCVRTSQFYYVKVGFHLAPLGIRVYDLNGPRPDVKILKLQHECLAFVASS